MLRIKKIKYCFGVAEYPGIAVDQTSTSHNKHLRNNIVS